MTPTDLDKLVSRTADTPGTRIGVAEVARVRSVLFRELSRLPAGELLATIANCLKSAEASRDDGI